jgi:hypothetical protein
VIRLKSPDIPVNPSGSKYVSEFKGEYLRFLAVLVAYFEVMEEGLPKRTPLNRMAEYLRRDRVSLCQGIAKVEKRLLGDEEFREKLKSAEEGLIEGRKKRLR